MNIKELSRKIFGNEPTAGLARYLGLNDRTVRRIISGEYELQPWQANHIAKLCCLPRFSLSSGFHIVKGEEVEQLLLHHNEHPQFIAFVSEGAAFGGIEVEINSTYTMHNIIWFAPPPEDVQLLLEIAASEAAELLHTI